MINTTEQHLNSISLNVRGLRSKEKRDAIFFGVITKKSILFYYKRHIGQTTF